MSVEIDEHTEFLEWSDPESQALAKAIDAAWMSTRGASFSTFVHEFKAIEIEFVARADDNKHHVGETKRRIAEAILREAILTEQPFDTCRQYWDDLLQLGFTNIEVRCSASCIYADCCFWNHQRDAGLQILGPLLAELERLRSQPAICDHEAEFYREQYDMLKMRFDKLEAQHGSHK
jgi:hypothetical protein